LTFFFSRDFYFIFIYFYLFFFIFIFFYLLLFIYFYFTTFIKPMNPGINFYFIYDSSKFTSLSITNIYTCIFAKITNKPIKNYKNE